MPHTVHCWQVVFSSCEPFRSDGSVARICTVSGILAYSGQPRTAHTSLFGTINNNSNLCLTEAPSFRDLLRVTEADSSKLSVDCFDGRYSSRSPDGALRSAASDPPSPLLTEMSVECWY